MSFNDKLTLEQFMERMSERLTAFENHWQQGNPEYYPEELTEAEWLDQFDAHLELSEK